MKKKFYDGSNLKGCKFLFKKPYFINLLNLRLISPSETKNGVNGAINICV